jgi:hypothetical protein
MKHALEQQPLERDRLRLHMRLGTLSVRQRERYWGLTAEHATTARTVAIAAPEKAAAIATTVAIAALEKAAANARHSGWEDKQTATDIAAEKREPAACSSCP